MTLAPAVRPASPADVPATAAIYNEGIRGRGSTFETRQRAPAEVFAWLRDARHPVLVAELEGKVVGRAA